MLHAANSAGLFELPSGYESSSGPLVEMPSFVPANETIKTQEDIWKAEYARRKRDLKASLQANPADHLADSEDSDMPIPEVGNLYDATSFDPDPRIFLLWNPVSPGNPGFSGPFRA